MGFNGGGGSLASAFAQVAKTPAGGAALTGGTPTFLTWTAPNDGNLHFVIITGVLLVTVAQTGGGIQYLATLNGAARNPILLPVTQGVGIYNAYSNGGAQAGWGPPENIAVDPNTTVSVVQSAAQTAGAAVFYGSIYAS